MRQRILRFFNNDNNIIYKSYFWNTIAGLLNAGQSVILLMFISRVIGLEGAGIFSIAYAIACLMLTIGNFGVRNYQATDTNEKYSFQNYLTSRFFTVAIMFLASFIYITKGILFDNYSFYKIVVIVLTCILKLLDSIEDVFEGRCQQNGRLDIASRCLSIRYIVVISVFCVLIMLTKNLVISLSFEVLISAIFIIWYIKNIFKQFGKIKIMTDGTKVKNLLFDCLPLFFGAYFSIYIGNAPKYAIDTVMMAEQQACFTFVFMPVFVIALLNNFIYQPILSKLAIKWKNREFKKFIKVILMQFAILIGIIIFVLMGGFLLGIPILSILYSTDLTHYKMELLILLYGGGMLAFSGFLNVVLTIMRRQKCLLAGYGVVAFIAMISSNYMVVHYGTLGAAFLYSSLMTLLALSFGIILLFSLKRDIKYSKE